MRDEIERERRRDGRQAGSEQQGDQGGLLRDMLRRIVGPREPAVYVMEPDGKLRRAGQ